MQAIQRHPAASDLVRARPAREPQRSSPVLAPSTGDDSPLPWFERWAERFIDRLVAWGDGAKHRRLGSWTRYGPY